jgi:hypothetical protein
MPRLRLAEREVLAMTPSMSRALVAAAAVVTFAAVESPATAQPAARRPNILVVFGDDIGHSAATKSR